MKGFIKRIENREKSSLNMIVAYLLIGLILFNGCGKSSIPNDINNQEDSSGYQNVPDYVKKIDNADWDSTWVSESILWKYYHFYDLFKAVESITIFDINLNETNIIVKIPYVTKGHFIKTSEAGSNVNAQVAINGSFFNTSEGGSSVFLKIDNQIITEGYRSFGQDAGFSIDKNGIVSILKRPTSGWEYVTSKDLLASGPLLVFQSEIVVQKDETRAPRTSIGLTNKNHLIAVVVDGRTSQAYGLTLKELAGVMKTLGCVSAMNLDGGGSSTAWVGDKGVVNYPSDNKKFDHEGERAVATVIAVIENK